MIKQVVLTLRRAKTGVEDHEDGWNDITKWCNNNFEVLSHTAALDRSKWHHVFNSSAITYGQ